STRQRDWFPGVNRSRSRKVFEIPFDQVGYPQEKTRTLGCRFFRPIAKCLLRCSDSKIDIVGIAVRDLRVRFASRRFDIVEISAGNRLDEFAINEVADLERLGAHGGEKD